MRSRIALAIAPLGAALLLNACADSSATGPARRVPSLNSVESETRCVGALPPGTYDNVIVPEATPCTLRESVVLGNVKAFPSASLVMEDVRVDGNVQGDRTFMVSIRRTTIEGNVEIRGGNFMGVVGVAIGFFDEKDGVIVKGGNIQIEKVQTGIISVVEAVVKKGNVQLVENVTDVLLVVEFNTVAENVQVFKNAGASPKFVTQNMAAQVQCRENTGLFFAGGPNITPKAEEQCF